MGDFMGFLKDFLPIFQKNKIIFVKKEKDTGNIVSFHFKLDEMIHWKAGQHGIFSFQKKMEGGSWRGFSIASSPHEDTIMISTRISENPSAYKKALMNLKPGDEINMRGPFGPFYLDESKRPAVFIAGGIGITPYRSLIIDSVQNPDNAPVLINLIYSDDNKEFAYKEEFDDIASGNGFIRVDYTTRETLDDNLNDCINKLGNNAYYFISGPGKMVDVLKKTLVAKGISKKNIKKELFIGL